MNIHKRVPAILRLCLAAAVLPIVAAGCGMHAGEVKKQYAMASGEYIAVVQGAVDQYRDKTGVLPIKNRDENTPIYEKYPIDFGKLRERHLLTQVPANAFENGGSAMYVLINPETKPEVKLMDLVAYQKIVEIQTAVDDYKRSHGGKLPAGASVAPHFSVLDFNKLGRKEEQIQSPFSRMYLTVIVSDAGQTAIDYGPEIGMAMNRKPSFAPGPHEDMRSILVSDGYFVPTRSVPYRMVDGQPAPSPE